MKKLRTAVTMIVLSLMLGGMTSCEITRHTEEGRHRGLFYRHDDHRDNRGPVLIIRSNNNDRHQHDEDDDD